LENFNVLEIRVKTKIQNIIKFHNVIKGLSHTYKALIWSVDHKKEAFDAFEH
jgi:hypothetical protein